MNKDRMNVRLDVAVMQRLSEIGDRYGMSANAILAAAAYELSRVRPENLWHALARIAEGEETALIGGGRQEAPLVETGKARPMLGR